MPVVGEDEEDGMPPVAVPVPLVEPPDVLADVLADVPPATVPPGVMMRCNPCVISFHTFVSSDVFKLLVVRVELAEEPPLEPPLDIAEPLEDCRLLLPRRVETI